MNIRAVCTIYRFEMARAGRTLMQTIISPVISTSLYFVVFGAAIGSRIKEIDGVSYGAFIGPGLIIMMMLLTQSTSNASFGIYFPKFAGTIFELLSAPISYVEIVVGYVGAAATKSIILGLIILLTAALFVPLHIIHPVWMAAFLVLTAVTFSLFGFHHRHLGRWVREVADYPVARDHTADVSWRQLLFHPDSAASLAYNQPVQPGSVPD
jgi:ABC-2 type transport system permease protein